MQSHANDFKRAENDFNVDAEVIAAIISVESDLGKNTGRHIIFYRLARLANCRDQNNVTKNYARLKQIQPDVTFSQVQSRATKLEEMFLPEVISILDSCNQGCDLFKLIGSPAGAFGIPQFLPSSYQKFAVDFNNNQKRTLFEVSDSIGSIANYLKSHGWAKNASDQDKMKAIWHYNHSQPYVDTVFQIYKELVKARARSCRVC
jgi:membrane-bound lytic murein transglycosylase B